MQQVTEIPKSRVNPHDYKHPVKGVCTPRIQSKAGNFQMNHT